MYVPRQFREERPEILAQAMRDIGFAALVTPAPEGLQVSHLPTVLKAEGPDGWCLETHLARPNPHWQLAGRGAPSVAIFGGPQAYVSPGWYASKREHGKVVPTWNYIAVHAHGTLELMEDADQLRSHLEDLTRAHEAGREHPWDVSDAPAEFVAGLTRAIVGLRLRVQRVEGAWKLIQHRSEADRLGTIAGLDAEPGGQAVAAAMRALEAAR
ncbi:FMN-binding negative transcriptional regulator [Roseomonas sp. BN140053]|uniref:FMN-binding negative transcriptional regulator n=1 Tax=Roseomonas sp. BN140053 TaxID=3391898 RepID=UPI0039E8CE4C